MRGEQSAKNHISFAEDRIERTCISLQSAALMQCIKEEIEAASDHSRAERDLNAQEAMALWAQLMTVVTGLSLLVTGAGVYYVRWTLIQTADTNIAAVSAATAANEANQIMRQEQRPWVVLEREIYCDFFERGFGCSLTWSYEFINKGKSPAYDVRLNWTVIKQDGFVKLPERLGEFVTTSLNGGLPGTPILFSGERTDHKKFFAGGGVSYARDKSIAEGDTIALLTCLSYRFTHASESERGIEARLILIEPSPNFYGPFGHTLLEYSNMRIIR